MIGIWISMKLVLYTYILPRDLTVISLFTEVVCYNKYAEEAMKDD